MQTHQAAATAAQLPSRKLAIEFLFLDVNACTRCLGTEANLAAALQTVQPVLEVTGAAVDMQRILIDSPAKAQHYHVVTSPTLRINGRDIALTTKESHCASCTDLSGSQASVDCRVWDYQGVEYTEAPVGMIVEAILQEVFGAARVSPPVAETPVDIPVNLQRFFAAQDESAAPDKTASVSACCGAKEQQSCCAPSAKATCCGARSASGSCGCK